MHKTNHITTQPTTHDDLYSIFKDGAFYECILGLYILYTTIFLFSYC